MVCTIPVVFFNQNACTRLLPQHYELAEFPSGYPCFIRTLPVPVFHGLACLNFMVRTWAFCYGIFANCGFFLGRLVVIIDRIGGGGLVCRALDDELLSFFLGRVGLGVGVGTY